MSTVGNAAVPARDDVPRTVVPRSWRTEDWIAVIIGFLVIAGALAAFNWKLIDLSKVTASYRWTTEGQIESLTPGWIEKLDGIARARQGVEGREQRRQQERARERRDHPAGQDLAAHGDI